LSGRLAGEGQMHEWPTTSERAYVTPWLEILSQGLELVSQGLDIVSQCHRMLMLRQLSYNFAYFCIKHEINLAPNLGQWMACCMRYEASKIETFFCHPISEYENRSLSPPWKYFPQIRLCRKRLENDFVGVGPLCENRNCTSTICMPGCV
jgi:hypothetical protein